MTSRLSFTITEASLPGRSYVSVKLSPFVEQLLRAQRENMSMITRDVGGREKRKHWIWWIFPTSKVGDNDPYGSAIRNVDDAQALLSQQTQTVLLAWLSVLARMLRPSFLGSLSKADVGRIDACGAQWRSYRFRGMNATGQRLAKQLGRFPADMRSAAPASAKTWPKYA